MFAKIINYFVGSYEELKKVVWPSRQEVINHTIIVVVTIVVAMAIVALLDFGLLKIMETFVYQ